MKIALLGTGAIGASIVRALYLNHIPFTILVRDKRRKDELLARGISYRLGGVTHVELNQNFQVQLAKDGKKYDYIFLGMKTPHLKIAGKTARTLLAKNGRIVLLQNGLPEKSISGFAESEIISGIVGYNTQLMPNGSFFQSNAGHLILAATKNVPTELKTALEPHLPIVLSQNVAGYRWNKLAINSVINGLGAVTGLALGPLFARMSGRRAAIALIKEAAAVMQALQIEEGVVPGAISVYKLARFPAIVQHVIIYVLGRKYAKIRTSMLQDIDRRVKTEVDEIHGAIVAAAQSVGVAVPYTSRIVDRVHALERGKTKPDASYLEEGRK